MSSLLKQFIKNIILEVLSSEIDAELSELQKGNIRDQLRLSKVFRRMNLNVDDFAEREENVKAWSSILTNGPIKHLGSGRQGTAFTLGDDKILKLQPGAPRAAEIEDALYSGSDVGVGLPSVLSTGIFKSDIGDIGWSITEKVQDADNIGKDEDWKVLWRAISDGIQEIVQSEKETIANDIKSMKKKGMSPQEISAMMSYAAEQGLPGTIPTKFVNRNPDSIVRALLQVLPADKMADVKDRYRLADDWFRNFIIGIQNHYKLGMVDFKPDNMGVRRSGGGPGYIIFFDAASAKLRDIKKWEPKI